MSCIQNSGVSCLLSLHKKRRHLIIGNTSLSPLREPETAGDPLGSRWAQRGSQAKMYRYFWWADGCPPFLTGGAPVVRDLGSGLLGLVRTGSACMDNAWSGNNSVAASHCRVSEPRVFGRQGWRDLCAAPPASTLPQQRSKKKNWRARKKPPSMGWFEDLIDFVLS